MSILIAWSPRTSQIASFRDVAFCLGDLDQTFNPATYFASGELAIHRSPLEWLLADRQGLVIVQPRYVWTDLRHARMSFADRVLAQRVRAWMQPPKATATFAIEASAEVAA